MAIRVWPLLLLALVLLLSSPFLPVVRCQSDEDAASTKVAEGSDVGIAGDDTRVFSDVVLGPASGVHTVCVFPKNAARLVLAGEETELLVGLHNEGESILNVIAVHASLHLPFDHRMFVQNLTLQEFNNASVPVSAQATFPYIFAVSKFLQPGTFDLVGSVVYEIEQQAYQNIFYNGTIEIAEAGGFISVESVFLVTLGLALIGFLGFWAYGQIRQFSKKSKRSQKVEVGTKTTDADMDEWLQGTAYAQSLSSKSKKKK
ncbi:translocon-associated protein subunit alpha-like [Curcuma longa]|uniref:translocon-associated protein subunit alpha-like n=1 Tax=Curcuma longa TaxID=136217 RepID=UPI003D9F6718